MLEIANEFFVGGPAAGGVEVHSCRTGFGKTGVNGRFNLFRTVADVAEFGVLALRAAVGNVVKRAAIVAYQSVDALVEGQCHIASGTVWCPAAFRARQLGAVTPTVKEEYGLSALGETPVNGLHEAWGKGGGHLLFPAEFLDILHLDFRQLYVTVSSGKFHKSVFPVEGVGIAFERRGGCAEKHLGTVEPCQHDGGIAGVVAGGRVLLFIGGFVLFVDDDESQVLEG